MTHMEELCSLTCFVQFYIYTEIKDFQATLETYLLMDIIFIYQSSAQMCCKVLFAVI